VLATEESRTDSGQPGPVKKSASAKPKLNTSTPQTSTSNQKAASKSSRIVVAKNLRAKNVRARNVIGARVKGAAKTLDSVEVLENAKLEGGEYGDFVGIEVDTEEEN
jgi:hypothetical protein